MSEEITSNIKVVYVPLLDEGTTVFRPTQAALLEGNRYEILAIKDSDPEDEKWEYPPGSVVYCVMIQDDDDEILVADRPARSETDGVKTDGVCGRARSINPAGESPAPVRQVSHRVASIGQAEVTPNVKHDVRKATGRKR